MSYIDRDALIERLCYLCGADCDKNICTVKQTVEYMPDADVEPIRHGEWIPVTDDVFADKHYCSDCMNYAEVNLYGEEILSKYCLNCGALMSKGET